MSFWTRFTSLFIENTGNDGTNGDDRNVCTEASERVDVRSATLSPYGPDSIQGEALLRDLPKERRIEGLDDIPCEGSALLQRLTEAAYPPLPRNFPALSVSQTLDLYGAYVHRTAAELPLKTADFNTLALPVIRKAICYMHLLPAAKDYHHKGMGGLLAHSFEVGILAARAATDHVFDRSETPRLLYHNRPRWIFAAWLAGFLHDAGKPVTDICVTSGGEVWYPYTESLVDWLQMNNRDGYFVSWKSGRVHNEHRPAVLSILPRIVSTDLIDWFRAYGSERIWKSCELAVSGVGGPEDLSLISNLVMRADEESTERDRKSRENLDERKLMVEAQPARRLLTAVKTLITNGTWTVNRPGSRLWVTNLGVFIVWNDVTAEEIWRCAVNDLGFRDLPRRAQNMVTQLDAAKCIRPAPEEVSSVQDRYWPVQFAAIPTKAFRCIGLVQADLIFEDGLMPPPSIPAKVVGLSASFEENFAWEEYVSSRTNRMNADAEEAGRIPKAIDREEQSDKENSQKAARRDIPFVRDLGTAEGEPGIAVDFSGAASASFSSSSSSSSASSDQDGQTARTESDDQVDEIKTETEIESFEVPVPSEPVHSGQADPASLDPSGAVLSSRSSPKSRQDSDVSLNVPMQEIENGEPAPDIVPGAAYAVGRTEDGAENPVPGGHHETNGLTATIVEETAQRLRFRCAEESGETLRPEISALLPSDENEAPVPSVRNESAQSTEDAADAADAADTAVAADKTVESVETGEINDTNDTNEDQLALLYPRDQQELVSDPYPSDRNREGAAQSSSNSDPDLDPRSEIDIGIDINIDIDAACAELPCVPVEPVHAGQEARDGDFRSAVVVDEIDEADEVDEVDEAANSPALSSLDGIHLPEETEASDPGIYVDGVEGIATASVRSPSPSPKTKGNHAGSSEDSSEDDWTRLYGEDALLDPEENEAAARFFTETVKRAQHRDVGRDGSDGFEKAVFRRFPRPAIPSPLPGPAVEVVDGVDAGGADALVFKEHVPSSDPSVSNETGEENPTTAAVPANEIIEANETGEPGVSEASEASGFADASESVASLFDGNRNDCDMREGFCSDNLDNSGTPDKPHSPTLAFPGTAAVVGAVIRSTGSTESTGDNAEGVQDSRRRLSRRSARDIPLSADADSLMPTPDVSDALAEIDVPVSRADIAKTKRAATRGARSADPTEGLLAEIRSNLETRSGPLWSEPVEDSPEGVFISPEKFFERAKELGLTKARVVQAVNSLWQPADRILAFKVVKSTGRSVRLIGLQKRR